MKVYTLVVAVLTCCFSTVLVQSVPTMIAVVVVQIITVPTGRWRSIDRYRRYRPFSTGRSLVHSNDTCVGFVFPDSVWVFFANKKLLARTETRTRERKDLQSIRTVSDIFRDDRPIFRFRFKFSLFSPLTKINTYMCIHK